MGFNWQLRTPHNTWFHNVALKKNFFKKKLILEQMPRESVEHFRQFVNNRYFIQLYKSIVAIFVIWYLLHTTANISKRRIPSLSFPDASTTGKKNYVIQCISDKDKERIIRFELWCHWFLTRYYCHLYTAVAPVASDPSSVFSTEAIWYTSFMYTYTTVFTFVHSAKLCRIFVNSRRHA